MAFDIGRRQFIAALGSTAATWPLAARAQREGGMPKVGVLMPGRKGDPDSQARNPAFRQGFADLGWKDGQNVHIEYRWADGKIELIRQYAEELVALAPNVILAKQLAGDRGTEEDHQVHPDRFRPGERSGRPRLREKSVASGRQHHRLHLHQPGDDRKMGGTAQGYGAGHYPSRAAVQSEHRPFLPQFSA